MTDARKTWTRQSAAALSSRFADAPAHDVLEWAVERFGDRLALASSFGAEDVALIDLLCRITESPRVFLLDTGRLHQETYDVVDRIRERYGIDIEVYCPQAEALEQLLMRRGPNSFYDSVEDRRECCRVRKVEPLKRALRAVDAWITGLRREQSPRRRDLSVMEIDDAHNGILKISPILGWSAEDLWRYIRANNVPYNRLHDSGYPSVGCAPCTRAVKSGEDLRAGRWWWESPEHKECGLHIENGEVIRP